MTAAISRTDESLSGPEVHPSSPSPPLGDRRLLDQSAVATAVQATLRILCFVIFPALLSGLTLRYLVPDPGNSEGWLQVVGRIGNQYPVPFAFALFLLFAWLVRYWHLAVPGGGYLTSLPARIAGRIGRQDLRAYAAAADLHRALANRRLGSRLRKMLTPEQQQIFDGQLTDLAAALCESSVERVTDAEDALRTIAAPALAAQKQRDTAWFAAGLVVAIASAMMLRLRVVETYQVLSASMLPALAAGDRIVVSKLAYRAGLLASSRDELSRSPQRGDIIVFQNTVTDGPEHVIKRVIGLPGDSVIMRGDHPVINGWEVPSCDAGLYVYPLIDGAIRGRLRVEFLGDHAYATVQGAGAPLPEPFLVKSGEVFVLGDNRTGSSDSRTWNGGKGAGVPFRTVDGRAEWFFLATRRDGRADFRELFRSPDRRLSAEGIDARSAEQGIERCLSQRPKDTQPPEAAHAGNSHDP